MLIEKIALFLSGWGVPPDTFFDVYIEEAGEEKSSTYYVYSTREVLGWIDTTLTFLEKRVGHESHEWAVIKAEVTAMLEAKSAQTSMDFYNAEDNDF